MSQETIERRASVADDEDDTYEKVFFHSAHTGCAMLYKDIVDLDGTTRAHTGSTDHSQSDISATQSRSDDDQEPIN